MKKIALTQGQFALVDDEDYEYLNQWKWHAQKGWNTFYAIRNSKTINGKRQMSLIHRAIMNPADGMQVDHIDHNGLNNQKVNLRIVTRQQNQMNRQLHKKSSSGFKGVFWEKNRKLWYSQIGYNRKSINLGYFEEEIDACIIYNQKAVELFGQYAHLNPIPDEYKNRIPVRRKAKTSSKYRCVAWRKDNQKWMAYIQKNKKRYYLGCFNTENDAHQAVLRAKELALSK